MTFYILRSPQRTQRCSLERIILPTQIVSPSRSFVKNLVHAPDPMPWLSRDRPITVNLTSLRDEVLAQPAGANARAQSHID
jgi:hypothetical protein